MAWDGPILTDSGGYQVFSLGHLRTVDDDGVTFASHLDGSVVRLTPERAIAIQEALGSDIAMVLDHLVGADASADVVTDAMERTHAWAARSLAGPAAAGPGACSGSCRAGWIGPCARHRPEPSAELPFDGIAIGGLSVGESKAAMASALDAVAETLGDDPRPRYLMGVGSPEDFFVAIEHGVDLFDCVLPTRLARHGQLWTSEGTPPPGERRGPGRPSTGGPGVPLRDVPRLLAGVPRPPVPGRGAARPSAHLGP